MSDDNKFNKILEDVSYMRGRVDSFLESQKEVNESVTKILQVHATEISTMKTEQGKVATKVGFLGTVFGVIGSALVNMFFKQ